MLSIARQVIDSHLDTGEPTPPPSLDQYARGAHDAMLRLVFYNLRPVDMAQRDINDVLHERGFTGTITFGWSENGDMVSTLDEKPFTGMYMKIDLPGEIQHILKISASGEAFEWLDGSA